MKNIAPKKSLGQNFLINPAISRRIVDTLNIIDGDTVVEIGPGTGALTFMLGEMPIFFSAIEIDERAIEKLSAFKPKSKSFEIIHADFRDFDFHRFVQNHSECEKIKLIGNIPYYLSAEIFFKVFNSASLIDSVVMMVQKDVALRLAARPCTKQYGVLTVANDLVCKTKIAFDVPPGCFFPKPNVMSSVIKMEMKPDAIDVTGFNEIMPFVKSAFNQRRKMLSNALAGFISNRTNMSMAEFIGNLPAGMQTFFKKRAEELSKDDYLELYSECKRFFNT